MSFRFLLLALTAAGVFASIRPTPVTFNKDVAPIVYRACAPCHRPGEVGPFSLLTYADVAKRAEQILSVTADRIMPPWLPDDHGEFVDGRTVSKAETETIRRWIADGKQQGAATDLPPMPKFVEGWQLGKPNLILEMADQYTVTEEGNDVYMCFVLPVDLPEDQWVKAVEFRPGNRKIVHHALIYMDTEGKARKLDARSDDPGYVSFGGPSFVPSGGFGGWAPGTYVRPLPNGVAKLLPKKCDVVVQIHYHPNGKKETDRSKIGIYFADEKPKTVPVLVPVASGAIVIPPGKSDYRVESVTTLPVDCDAIGVFPHAHYICKEMTGTAILPDGTQKTLIHIKDWDFNWQEQYRYNKPIHLPSGTKLKMTYVYDNSAKNPRNPSNPPKWVKFGPATTDEMAILWVQVLTKKPSDTPVLVDHLLKQLPGAGAAGLLLDGNQKAELEKLGLIANTTGSP